MDTEIVLSIDPGRDKCGMAVVGRKGSILLRQIVSTGAAAETAKDLIKRYQVHALILGNSTGSRSLQQQLEGIENEIPIVTVDEYRSTDEGRHRYWEMNPPQGLWRLVPSGMRTPPVPIDDYAAIILAERYFRAKSPN